jgi:hypothetical protein
MAPLAGGALARQAPPKTPVGGYFLLFLWLFTFFQGLIHLFY